jgi:hypothetical protein
MAQAGILQSLPALHLTQLDVALDWRCNASVEAVGALSRLRHLTLRGSELPKAGDSPAGALNALAPMARLQHLTWLQIGPVLTADLQQLPPQLQQLHVAVSLQNDPQQLLQLARWLPQHASILCTLELQQGPDSGCFSYSSPLWGLAVNELLAAVQAAAVAVPAAATKVGWIRASQAPTAGTAAAGPALQHRSSSQWQLQAMSFGPHLPGLALAHLPVDSLTRPECCIDWASATDVSALCRLTGLHELHADLGGCFGRYRPAGQANSVLVQLSALQQLTQLHFGACERQQLQRLRLPGLQQLHVEIAAAANTQLLRLGHLTSLQSLSLVERMNMEVQHGDQLPFGLRELMLDLCCGDNVEHAVQRLEHLNHLEKLCLNIRGPTAAASAAALAESLIKLTCIGSLQGVEFSYQSYVDEEAALLATLASAWTALPLKSLHLKSGSRSIPVAAVQQVSALQGLTRLQLPKLSMDGAFGMTPAHLALMLSPLTALRKLQLSTCGEEEAEMVGAYNAREDVASMLRAVGCMRKLQNLDMFVPVKLWHTDVVWLEGMLEELLTSSLAKYCHLHMDLAHILA